MAAGVSEQRPYICTEIKKLVDTKKIRWVSVLMVISQLMLAGFMIYWLASQYRDEKKLLGNDLARLYEESRSQVIDSLVFSHVVEPALQDSVTITMITRDDDGMEDSAVSRTARSRAVYTTRSIAGSIATAVIPDSGKYRMAKTAEFSFSPGKQDILIRSVKLMISHNRDSASPEKAFAAFLPEKPDTALFRKVFMEKLSAKYDGLHVVWTMDLPDTAKPAGNIIIVKNATKDKLDSQDDKGRIRLSGFYPDDLPDAEIRHDFPFLLKQIIPQILFGLILLILSGSAFSFTSRNLRRQLMLNSLRNDFVNNITHELRTPVATVKVALEALKTFDKVHNPEITQEYLDMAAHEMNRLEQLIGTVLDQSLIGDRQDVVQPQPSDIKLLINSSLNRIQPRISARHGLITLDVPELPQLPLDPLHFEGVLINLVDNSLKYGPEKPEIRIRVVKEDAMVLVEVSDNGPGIPKEYLGRVFDKFFRVPAGDTHTVKGYGLGLSFAALVMKQHGGSISVRNLKEGGCAFTLRFPVSKA
jgi:signal transduction histidine kinase